MNLRAVKKKLEKWRMEKEETEWNEGRMEGHKEGIEERKQKDGKRQRWMQEGMKGSNNGKGKERKDKKGKMEIQKGKRR